jgi:DNA-binding NtrC family response regulator
VSEELKGGIETILVIDDEEAIRSYCSEVLSKFGYTVLTAESSDSALKIYAREWPTIDLVMIDLIMPNQSGMECLDKLLKINPLARIIIASGHFPDAATRKMIQDRAGTFIQKPYGIESLLKSVRRVLEEKS